MRNGLKFSRSLLGRPYVVHELRFPDDPETGDYTELPPQRSELSGSNVLQIDGEWKDIYKDEVVSVSAAPIHHSVPCVGYVVTEAPVPGKIDPSKYIPVLKRTKTPMSAMRQLQQGASVALSDGTVLHGPPKRPGRKLVILGDTYDPSPIIPIAQDADLLIHEATNAHLPGIDSATKDTDTFALVEERTKSRGHSTPQMAGAFARRIGTRFLILNHFSARYPGDNSEPSRRVMEAIANLAKTEYKCDSVLCARDLSKVDIKLRQE